VIGDNEHWETLREMRARGRFPKLVIVTDVAKMPLRGTGDYVIDHRPGEPMPITLLDGLNVIFWFSRCLLAGRAAQLAQERGVKFARARSYCRCACSISVCTFDCDTYPATLEWLGGGG
jgi:hypothetical protein